MYMWLKSKQDFLNELLFNDENNNRLGFTIGMMLDCIKQNGIFLTLIGYYLLWGLHFYNKPHKSFFCNSGIYLAYHNYGCSLQWLQVRNYVLSEGYLRITIVRLLTHFLMVRLSTYEIKER